MCRVFLAAHSLFCHNSVMQSIVPDAVDMATRHCVQGYQLKRLPRASTIHGLAGMAAIMASTYKAYLGEGLGPLSFIKELRIPHPGRVRQPEPDHAVGGSRHAVLQTSLCCFAALLLGAIMYCASCHQRAQELAAQAQPLERLSEKYPEALLALPLQVGGYFAMNMMMPMMLGWVLGGNISQLRRTDRIPACRLGDAPKAFREREFWRFLADDRALLSAARAHWTLVPAAAAEASADAQSDAIDAAQNGARHLFGLRIAFPEHAREICAKGLTVGSAADAEISIDSPKARRRAHSFALYTVDAQGLPTHRVPRRVVTLPACAGQRAPRGCQEGQRRQLLCD